MSRACNVGHDLSHFPSVKHVGGPLLKGLSQLKMPSLCLSLRDLYPSVGGLPMFHDQLTGNVQQSEM
jgi:hypothetical protein